MNFWTIIFIIYIFNTCACLVTLFSRSLMSKRLILSQFPDYYNKHPRASAAEKFFNLLSLFFQCAFPVYHVILLLGLLGVPEPDVCKDFELSYFAPEDWSMTNGVCNRVRTYKSRYLNAINYILTFGSGNFRDHVEAYFLSIGVTSQEITEFRNLMLK